MNSLEVLSDTGSDTNSESSLEVVSDTDNEIIWISDSDEEVIWIFLFLTESLYKKINHG